MTMHAHHHVRQSSADSFYDRIHTGAHQSDRDRISEYVLRAPGKVTRRQIARDLGVCTATVSGLVRPLIVAKVIYEYPDDQKAPCPVTGRNVNMLIHMSKVGLQPDLFGGAK